MEASKEGGKNIIRLIADTQLVDTDKYDIFERGVLYYTAAEGYPGYLIMEDVDNGTKVRMAEVTQTGSIGGRLPINVGTATNRVVYARAYVVVMEKNGNSKTPEKRYSETISGSFESLGGGL